MANDATFTMTFRVREDGSLMAVEKNINKAGKAVRDLGSAQANAGKQSDDLYSKQNKGIIGTANSTKSFSKLSQTIGEGSSGLVGAYATLAANAFAVSAAFIALRDAAKVEQLFRGLEIQGARMGVTLTNVAKQVVEVAQGALSMEEGMRAVAQVSSAGFGTEEVLALTQAAKNASIALGRNMVDSMDRMTKGVIKLEPELLDELGVMVKLTEATNKYASQNGKTAASLTSFEKRQAFLNAVLEESNTKFGALSETTDANPYDKLAAAFVNLTQQVLTFANNSGIVAFVELLANNTTALLSVIVMFIGTISRQLVPSLYAMSAATLASRDALEKKITTQKKAVATTLLQAKAEREAQLAQMRQLPTNSQIPKGYKDYVSALKEGNVQEGQREKALKSLSASIRRHETLLEKTIDTESVAYRNRQALIVQLGTYKQAVMALSAAEANSQAIISAATIKAEGLAMQSRGSRLQSFALTSRAMAIEAAGNFELGKSYTQLSRSNAIYARSARTSAAGSLLAAQGGSFLSRSIASIGAATVGARVGLFALGTAARAVGAVLLNAIPIIGQVLFVFSLLAEFGPSIWDWMFPPAAGQEALDKAKEELDTILERVKETAAITSSIFADNASSAKDQAQAFLALSNTVNEVVASYSALKEAQSRLGTSSVEAGVEQLASAFEARVGDSISSDLKESAEFRTLGSLVDLGYSNMTDDIMKATIESEAFNKANEAGQRRIMAGVIEDIGEKYASVGLAIQDVRNSYKELDDSVNAFINSAKTSTPFDSLTQSVTNSAVSLLQLEAELKSGAISFEDYGRQIADIGGTSMGLMSEETQRAAAGLTDLNKRIADLQVQKERLVESNDIRGGALQIETNINSAIEQRNEYQAQLGTLIQRDLLAQQRNLLNMQRQSVIAQGMAKVEEARFNRSKTYIEGTSEGYKAEIAHEERMRAVQVTRINAERTLLELLNLQKQEALSRSRLEAEALQIRINNVKTGQNELSILGLIVDKIQQLGAMVGISTFETATEEATRLEAELARVNASIIATEYEASQLGNSIESLNLEAAALLAQNLTAAEVAARALGIDLENIARLNDIINSTVSDIYQYDRDRLRLSQSSTTELADQVSQLRRVYQQELLLTRNRNEQANNATRSRITLQRAGIASLAVNSAQRQAAESRLLIMEQELLLTIEQQRISESVLSGQLAINIAELAKLDIFSEGLQIQQESLSLMEKELSVRSELAGQETTIARLRATIASKQAGGTGELPEELDWALEAKAAQTAYQLAQEEFQLKMAQIDAEYALLEAQRRNIMFNLDAQKTILVAQANADNNITEAEATGIAQIQQALDNLNATDYTFIKDLAVQAAEGVLETSRLQAVNAMIRPGVSDTVSTASIQAAMALEAYDEAVRIRTQRVVSNTESLGTVTANTSLLQDRANSAMEMLNTSLEGVNLALPDLTIEADNLTAAFNRFLTTLTEQGAVAAQAATVSRRELPSASDVSLRMKPGAASNGPANELTMQFARLVQERIPGFNRVTALNDAFHAGRGGQHPAGRAFDFTTTTGASNSAQVTQMVEELAKEFGVQIRTLDEYANPSAGATGGHIHVTVVRAIEQVTQAAVTAVTDAVPTISSEVTAALTAQDIATTANTAANNAANSPVTRAEENNEEGSTLVVQAQTAQATLERLSITSGIILTPILENLRKLGPEGEAVANATVGMQNLLRVYNSSLEILRMSTDELIAGSDGAFGVFEAGAARAKAGFELAGQAIGAVSGIISAATDIKISAIDREIAVEQKRDGKSAESVAKIEALEKKKDSIARKSFNMQKKMQIAQAIMSTAAGVAGVLSQSAIYGPILTPILAGMIGAMGLAQVALISSTQYQSSSSGAAALATPQSLSVGKRSDTIDLARGPNANAGGEVSYLRGSEGTGSNASNYRTVGSAYGGELMRGYGNRGFVVGEKGPEVITPETPISVTPANDVGASQPVNATFNIQAIDSQGVQDVLVAQKGNIISMLREAANASGKSFMEDVNVNVYTRPSVGKL